MKIVVGGGQGHHLQGLGPALGPDLAGGLALGQAEEAPEADPNPSLRRVQSLDHGPNRGGAQSQNHGPGRGLDLRGRLTPDQGPAPAPLSRIESPAPGLTRNPSPRLNLYPRNGIVLTRALRAKADPSLALCLPRTTVTNPQRTSRKKRTELLCTLPRFGHEWLDTLDVSNRHL